jgi:hypothetical protein
MKALYTLLTLGLLIVLSGSVFAQHVGDYQSNGSGSWGTASLWQRWNGSSWVTATVPPDGSQDSITIRNADSMAVTTTITIQHVLQVTGTARTADGGGAMTFGPNSVFLVNRDAGNVPLATWSNTSIVRILGSTTAGPQFPSDRQYGNVEFESHALAANVQLNMTGTSLTINGRLWVGATLSAAGSTMQLRLSGSSATFPSLYRTYYINGDIVMDSTRSILTTSGSSTANTGDSVYVGGNVIVNAGEFSLNRGSGASAWFFLNGDFYIAPGARMTRHSSSNYPAMIFFTKTGRQNFTNLGTITTGYFKPIDMFVNSGSIFNTGTSQVTGGINFTLWQGAALETARDGGVDSAIICQNGSGTAVVKVFEAGSSYTFNGTVPQVTGSLMPATIANLTINNPAGVALTATTQVTNIVHLVAGQLDNTVPFTLGPSGSISYEGGTLRYPMSVKQIESTIPGSFYVSQNYPNPFNPSTTIRFGIPSATHVTARVLNLLGQQVSLLYDGRMEPGVYAATFDASHLASGLYFCQVQSGSQVSVKRMILMK